MRSLSVVLIASVCLMVVASGYIIDPPIPVPRVPYGILYNKPASPRAAVLLEVFIGVHCPDSLAAWPILKQVSAHYGPEKLDLLVHQLPLPYQRNSYLGTQGLYVIQNNLPDKVFNYIEANLENYSTFSTANTAAKSEVEVLDILADLAVASTGIDKDLFKSQIGSYRSYTTGAWKYAVKRGNAAVPSYFVNGVELGVGNNRPTFSNWVRFLDPLINN